MTGDFSTTTVSPARVSEVGVGGGGTTAGPTGPAGVGTRAMAGLTVGRMGLARTSCGSASGLDSARPPLPLRMSRRKSGRERHILKYHKSSRSHLICFAKKDSFAPTNFEQAKRGGNGNGGNDGDVVGGGGGARQKTWPDLAPSPLLCVVPWKRILFLPRATGDGDARAAAEAAAIDE